MGSLLEVVLKNGANETTKRALRAFFGCVWIPGDTLNIHGFVVSFKYRAMLTKTLEMGPNTISKHGKKSGHRNQMLAGRLIYKYSDLDWETTR